MPGLIELWLPIVVATVAVFIASCIAHMALTHHQMDYRGMPDENAALSALRALNIPPGDYFVPHGGGMAAMKDPAFVAKMTQGPLVLMRLRGGGMPNMGKMMGLWLLYLLAVSVFVAYIAGHTLAAGSDYLSVFRVTGCVAFLAYAAAHCSESIWYWRRWGTTLRYLLDGLAYALLTGGVFGWLWPAAVS